MLDPAHPIAALLDRDKRYRFDAYVFVFEALRYAQEVLGLGMESPTEASNDPAEQEERAEDDEERKERHLTGQELCEAIRLYAIEQYGYMAKSVLNHWGITCTGDLGEIVFNLIGIGQMRKTPEDRREDFDNVFDFDEGFHQNFEITLPD